VESTSHVRINKHENSRIEVTLRKTFTSLQDEKFQTLAR
jgi:hypothetical protein